MSQNDDELWLAQWLPLIAEECAEITKDAMKALRFGLHDHPRESAPDSPDNLARIKTEIADLIGTLESAGFDIDDLRPQIEAKKAKLKIFGPKEIPSPYIRGLKLRDIAPNKTARAAIEKMASDGVVFVSERREAEGLPPPKEVIVKDRATGAWKTYGQAVGTEKETSPAYGLDKPLENAPPPPAPDACEHVWRPAGEHHDADCVKCGILRDQPDAPPPPAPGDGLPQPDPSSLRDLAQKYRARNGTDGYSLALLRAADAIEAAEAREKEAATEGLRTVAKWMECEEREKLNAHWRALLKDISEQGIRHGEGPVEAVARITGMAKYGLEAKPAPIKPVEAALGDLVKRLKSLHAKHHFKFYDAQTVHMAAEALVSQSARAENAEVDAKFNLERRTVEREQAREAIKRLCEALKFYADPGDYKAPFTGGGGKLYFDCGERARNALAQGGNNG